MIIDRPLKILAISPEGRLMRSGGLGQAAGSLAVTMFKMGHDVRLAVPKYVRHAEKLKPRERPDFDVDVLVRGIHTPASIFRKPSDVDGMPEYLVDNPKYFNRFGMYEDKHKHPFDDNGERFAYFSLAALSIPDKLRDEEGGPWKPDIIHCHDWQTGMVPVFFDQFFKGRKGKYAGAKTVQTVHNASFLGPDNEAMGPAFLDIFGLNRELFNSRSLEYFNKVRMLIAGLRWANAATTVSQNYAAEVMNDFPDPSTPNRQDLQCVFKDVAARKPFLGILNGYDYEGNTLLLDKRLRPIIGRTGNIFEAKRAIKRAAQERFGLDIEPETPLIGVLTRLDPVQKGCDIMLDAIPGLLGKAQFVVCGTGDSALETRFWRLHADHPKRIRMTDRGNTFNHEVTELITSGCDLFWIPSRFEPCGLVQFEAMAYATLVIARSTGGLKDTVFDIGENLSRGNGFTFRDYSSGAVSLATLRAIDVYHNAKDLWHLMMERAYRARYTWQESAEQYLKMFYSQLGMMN
ncbi:MAG: glycogen/starch synthase [Candidatus Saganbacteria bacterium]|nr:glycogen/starch synthase [Candidatus Saganbacteria bacterium]